MKRSALFGGVALFATLMIAARAHDDATTQPEGHIDALEMGEYWYGARIDKRELIGKVVLLEYWGS